MSKKITQDDLDALEQKFHDETVRLKGKIGLFDTVIDIIKLDVEDLKPQHSELAVKDEIILTLSKEIESLTTEKIILQTRIVQMKKEIEELKEKVKE